MEGPNLCAAVRAECVCVCVSVTEERGFPTVAGLSEAWLAQRDVFAAPGTPPSPLPTRG